MIFPLLHIWVNYNNSLTWIKAIWGWFPLLTMIPVRSQWGRYNLPRHIQYILHVKNSVKIFYEWISHCHVWWRESVLVYIYRKSSIKLVDFNCHIWLPDCKSNHIPVSSRYFPQYIILHLLPHIPNHRKLLFSGTSIWVNHNISQTWIVRPLIFPFPAHALPRWTE